MPRFALSFLLLLLLVGTAACGGRKPGPHERERGKVTFWTVTGTSVDFDACTDAATWQANIAVEPPPIGWYLIYVVSEDGTEAVTQECETTQASTCTESSTGGTFAIAGHTFTQDPAPELFNLTGSSCDLEMDQFWSFEDQGETAPLTLTIASSLVGDPTECTTLDDQIKSESANGLGYEGCTITLSVEQEFFQSEKP